MLNLNAKTRKEKGKKTKSLKEAGKIPGVVYGNKIKNISLEVNAQEFKKVLDQVGESSLVNLKIDDEKTERPVLIHDLQKDAITGNITHVDFYQASLKEEIEISVPLVFEGVSPAVKELSGTLIRELQEIKVKALPQSLPHNISVDISVLKTFEDEVKAKDIKLPAGVKISGDLERIVAVVVPPTKVEEELEKPIEEKVEDVEKVEKKQKDVVGDEVEEKAPAKPAEKK